MLSHLHLTVTKEQAKQLKEEFDIDCMEVRLIRPNVKTVLKNPVQIITKIQTDDPFSLRAKLCSSIGDPLRTKVELPMFGVGDTMNWAAHSGGYYECHVDCIVLTSDRLPKALVKAHGSDAKSKITHTLREEDPLKFLAKVVRMRLSAFNNPLKLESCIFDSQPDFDEGWI